MSDAIKTRLRRFGPENCISADNERRLASRQNSAYSGSELPAVLDLFVGSMYRPGMLARLVTLLAMLAIAVMTTVTTAHAAGLSAEPDHAVHVSEMIQAAESEHSCEHEQRCASAHAGACEVLCAGLSVFAPSPGGEAVRGYGLANQDLPSATIPAGRAPGLNERPPKLRLV